jgi:hypothetical protein
VITATLLALLSEGGMALLLRNYVVPCDAALATVSEPKGWQSFSPVNDLGNYTIEGEPLMVKYRLGLIETELRDPRLCPRGGVSLDDWFVRGPQPSMYRTTSEIGLRRSGDVMVVSGTARMPASEETFIVAFRRDIGHRLAFTSGRAEALFLALALVVVLAARGFVGVDRARREALRYADRSIYKPGMRDEDGVITFEDGSTPLAPDPSTCLYTAGSVLVRVEATRAGGYREAPSTRATAVVTGDAATLSREALARAVSSLKTAAIASIVVFLASALIGSYMAVNDAMRTFF